MAQSDIQSLLQQATGMQTTGQSWLPSSINNGNPNTVYNQPPPEGGYIPPTSDDKGNWMINKPQPSQVVDWSTMIKDPDKVADPYKPVWDLSTSVPPAVGQPAQPQPGTPAPAPAGPKTTPYVPVGEWFGPKGIRYGGNMEISNQALVNNNPAAKFAWDTVFAMHKGKFDKTSDWAAVQKDLEKFYQAALAQGIPTSGGGTASSPQVEAAWQQTGVPAGGFGAQQATASGGSSGAARAGVGGSGGAGKGTSFFGIGSSPSASQGAVKGTGSSSYTGSAGGGSTLQGLQNLPDGIQQSLGVNADGSISWEQIADFILPGNAYLSQTGQWDASNVIANVLGQITGLPIDSLMTKLGEYQAGQDDPQNWFEKMLIDHYMDKNQNWLAGKMNISQQQFKQSIAPAISQALADSIDLSSMKMQDAALNDLLTKAEKKMQEKLNANQPKASGGGGGGREGGGGRASGANYMGDVKVQFGSGRAPRGPGTVTVGDIETTKQK